MQLSSSSIIWERSLCNRNSILGRDLARTCVVAFLDFLSALLDLLGLSTLLDKSVGRSYPL